MFSRKSNFSVYILISLVSFFLVFAGCKSVSTAKGTDNAKQPAAKKQVEKKQVEKKTNTKTQAAVKSVKEEPEDNTPDDGYIRLVLNEKKGNFSLYYLSDPKTMRYEPLFNSNNSSSSFLSVLVDDNIYNLGSTNKFKTRIEREKKDMALVFESPTLKITQVFSPIKTSSSQVANGVMITMSIQNTGTERSFVGLRMLLDTELGEGKNGTPILTNKQVVSSELLLEGHSNDRYWISRGKKISLMGSIVNPIDVKGKGPDLVHIANWKRLRDSQWRLNYSKGRSFNNLPYSVGDSAVCYYFGPEMIDRNKILTYTVFLTTEDTAWYNLSAKPFDMTASIISDEAQSQPIAHTHTNTQKETVNDERLTINIPAIEAQASIEAAVTNEDENVIVLIKLQEILNQFIAGQMLINELDLAEIEKFIEKYRVRN